MRGTVKNAVRKSRLLRYLVVLPVSLVSLLLACGAALKAAERNDLQTIYASLALGDTRGKCNAEWSKSRNVSVQMGKSGDPAHKNDEVVVLRLQNHALLNEESYVTLVFANGVLKKKTTKEFCRLFD